VAVSTSRCEHCGAWFEERSDASAASEKAPASPLKSIFAPLPPEAGEFGLAGSLPLAAGIGLAVVIYALGWLLEDTRFWLAPRAVAMWGALLPIWLGLVAFVWRTRHAAWSAGPAIALAIFAIHLGIVWILRRRINDDLLGIAAVFAGLAFTGWLLGRVFRALLRRRRMHSHVE
jgi:hypothetical protein